MAPPRSARTLTVVFLALATFVGSACGDDDEGGTATTRRPGSTAEQTTTSTEPPGTSPADVEPHIVDLLAQLDEVTNQIIAEPSVAADPNHPLIVEYLSLVEPGSVAEGAIETWNDNATEGVSVRPYSDAAPPRATRLDGPIETVTADEVTFPTCEAQNYRLYDAQGRETEFVTEQSVPGEGTAVRVDGEWRLRRMDIASNVVGCRGGDA